ncbi:hypothetical protein Tsp_12464 [Trichinella spiralis]|uniref:hypothetical protein n=1 Tax=Trichinella spiralis TaxID=6334 RepID=UPI0001EFE03C|nr:hypothetical protein Tsp_12464 [Trichinella spiralis]
MMIKDTPDNEEFHYFIVSNAIRHVTITPYRPASNWQAVPSQQTTALSLDDQNLQCASERTVFDHKGRRTYHLNSVTLEMSHYRVEEFQLFIPAGFRSSQFRRHSGLRFNSTGTFNVSICLQKSQLTFLKRQVFYGCGPLHLLQCLGDCGRLFTCRQRGFQAEPS